MVGWVVNVSENVCVDGLIWGVGVGAVRLNFVKAQVDS